MKQTGLVKRNVKSEKKIPRMYSGTPLIADTCDITDNSECIQTPSTADNLLFCITIDIIDYVNLTYYSVATSMQLVFLHTT